jgi:pyruvate,orthophosphate dikinase
VLQARSAQMEVCESPRTFKDEARPVGRGIGVSGGAFRGRVAFNEKDVRRLRSEWVKGDPEADGILLVLENPVPEEIPLILSVDGLLSARGGSTSHAAVAVHSIEDRIYSAVLGVSEFRVSADKAELRGAGGAVVGAFRAGDVISIHGQTGEVFAGSMAVVTIGDEA